MRVACLYFKKPSAILELAQACERFSPQISVREPQVILIEVGKCRGLYSEASFRSRVRVLTDRFKCKASIGIGSDIPTALAFARFGVEMVERLPIESLEDFGDPFRVDPEGRKTIQKMIESLKRLGIQSVGEFKSLPVEEFPSRFGGIGLYCRQRVEGASDLPWPRWIPPETYSESMELLPSEFCADLEPLLFKSKELLDRLFSRLRGKFLRVERLRVSLELERNSAVKNPIREWSFEFISPQGSTSGFLPIYRERLNRDLQNDPIESQVIAVRIEAQKTVLGNEAQRNFFHSRDDFKEAMGSVFGQLEEYLGPKRVFWAKITEHRFPEKSWERSRLSDVPQAEIHGQYPRRPSRIFQTPIPLRVIEDRIRLKGRSYKTLRWSQVERLTLDWIDDAPSRNYYRVDLEGGSALWVFSDPGHHFFVHGYYE